MNENINTPYDTLLKTYNRERPKKPRETCECGKQIYVSQRERHLNTQMHRDLLYQLLKQEQYKSRTEQKKNQRIELIKLTLVKLQNNQEKLMKELETLENK